MKSLSSAMTAWTSILGEQFVSSNLETLGPINLSTFHVPNKILGALSPSTVNEVSACVKVANQYKIPLYPISGGCNTGYGSKLPNNEASVLINLSRLNHILDFSNEFGYVTIEPGVSFEQLFCFLRDNNSDFIMSSTWALSQASIIGNTLEKGIGKGPDANRVEKAFNFQVVTPTGDIIDTAAINDTFTSTASLMQNQLGPSLDGLFPQSNFGIVTRMTIWLRVIPRILTAIFFCLEGNDNLSKAVNFFQEMLKENVIENGFSIANEARKMIQPDQLSLIKPEENVKNLREDIWWGTITTASFCKEEAEYKKKYLLDQLSSFASHLKFFDVDKESCQALMKKTAEYPVAEMELGHKLLLDYLGYAQNKVHHLCYWKKDIPLSERKTAEADGCGLIWIDIAIPFSGKTLQEVIASIQPICKKHHLDMPITLKCISSRVILLVMPLLFDAHNPLEDKNAQSCYVEIFSTLMKLGHFPHRVPIGFNKLFFPKDTSLLEYIRKMKRAVDPNNIIAPGRYEAIINED